MQPNSTAIRIIWITPKFPLGTPDGARHATCVLIRNLAKLGVQIDLICLLPHGERADPATAREQLGVVTCTLISRSGSILSPLPCFTIPLTFRTFAADPIQKALQNEISQLMNEGGTPRKHFVLFDGLHTFAGLATKDFKQLASITNVIYRAHNVESILWEQSAQKAAQPWRRWLIRHQASLVKKLERSVAQETALVASVSDDDAARFTSMAPDAHVTSIPIGIDFPPAEQVQPVAAGGRTFEVLFVGRLDWTPNKEGLRWLLEEVWVEAARTRPNLHLTIAGVGDGTWLKKYQELPGIEILGRVDSLEPLYHSCALTIAPIFQGSGTRVKILESARFARPTLSTALGAEGSGLLPGISFYQAETRLEWLEALTTLSSDQCRTTGLSAFSEARGRLDGYGIAKQFLKRMESIRDQQTNAFFDHFQTKMEALVR